jgi:hypothetical protein
MFKATITLISGLLLLSLNVQADPVSELQAGYARQAPGGFSADNGRALWNREFTDPKSGKTRSCTLCHTSDITATGKHARTGKRIEPMAPSVNPQRLTDKKKLKKWLKRNCKWTLGRECTPQEKGDLLAFISSQ